jgi:hypothetical protein
VARVDRLVSEISFVISLCLVLLIGVVLVCKKIAHNIVATKHLAAIQFLFSGNKLISFLLIN